VVEEIRFVAAIGAVGGGIDASSLDEAMGQEPHFIAADAGTTDAGPCSLGSGQPAFPREMVKHDLELMLLAGKRAGVPVIVGSAGTAGGDAHVDWTLDIAREVASENGLSFRTGVIYSEQDKSYLKNLLRENRIRPLDPAPQIDEAVIDRSTRIVGMMGVEPLQRALAGGAEFVLAGRCSDSALYAALPILRGFPQGLAWHAGKVSECGTMAAETMGKGVIFGRIRRDYFTLRPFGPGLRCTPQSVAAHSLYENVDPYLHPESSGTLDLSKSTFEAEDAVSVRITGSAFIPSETYSVKLEGAELVGYQSMIVGGIRDRFVIQHLDSWLAGVRERIETAVAKVFGDKLSKSQYHLTFHVYGRDGVMGKLEPDRSSIPKEIGLVLEATAPTQEIATTIAILSRQPLLHHPVPEWKGAITTFACLHNPAHIDRGPVYRFNFHHVALPHTQEEMFRAKFIDIGVPAK
jgi:Acyclic terpene utilisation family protein AtuA